MKKKRARNNPSNSLSAKAIQAYEELHDGLRPASVTTRKPPRTPVWAIALGRLSAVEYEKPVLENGRKRVFTYRHPFAKHAQPILARDQSGKLLVDGGRYITNERGIVDMNTRGFVFANPTSPKKGAKKGAKKRSSSKGGKPTVNSSKRFVKDMLKAAGAGVLYEAIGDIAMNQTTWSPETRGSIQGLVGIGLGLAVHRRWPNVAMGLAIVGASDIIDGALHQPDVESFISGLLHPAASSTTAPPPPSTPGTTTPSTGLLGPGAYRSSMGAFGRAVSRPF